MEKLKASDTNIDAFIEKAKRYTTIDKQTPELMRLFIQRVEVGEWRQKYFRFVGQSVKSVYRDIVEWTVLCRKENTHIMEQITAIQVIKQALS